MTPEERTAFIQKPRTAVLSTTGADGHTHAVPVWYRYTDGAFRIITARDSVKVRNVAANPPASLCMDDREGRFAWVTAEGPVEVACEVTKEERLALHTHYRGAEAAQKIVDAGGHEGMVLLILTPERWLPSR